MSYDYLQDEVVVECSLVLGQHVPVVGEEVLRLLVHVPVHDVLQAGHGPDG